MERDSTELLSQQERWLQQRIDLLEKQLSELHALNRNHTRAYQALKQQHNQERANFYTLPSNQNTIQRAALINRQSSQHADLIETYIRSCYDLQARHREESQQLNERINSEHKNRN